ncbi:DUF4651 domain-containing protein [Streptococcus sp. sy018]|uniref:DUF4651 domain-containing protein n=1 Tax=Streptococcus sp. sy018 TaxID=2600147 RepID=UPI0011B36056|nr:DUF4651 domain-containing protein [Streptococcus sp. sy018]TWS94650.1 DUF4651 domain-containing protein [Streptococcus sp. sy018]
MKQKKIALLGLTSLAAWLVYHNWQKQTTQQVEEKEMTDHLRQFFSQFGQIEVLYFNDYRLDDEARTGGVVMTTGQAYEFSYYQGDFTYQEVANVTT